MGLILAVGNLMEIPSLPFLYDSFCVSDAHRIYYVGATQTPTLLAPRFVIFATSSTDAVHWSALAASANRPGSRPSTSAGSAPTIFRGSSSTPITPVEAGSTWNGGILSIRADGLAGGLRHGIARPRGAIGVARVHDDGPHLSLGGLQQPPAQLHRRGLHVVLREDGGGIGRKAGDDQGEVVLFHLADSGVSGRVKIARAAVSSVQFS